MSILSKIIDLLFPQKCICCDEILKEKSRFGLCKNCTEKAEFIPLDHRCKVCSAPIGEGEKLCVSCKTHKRNFVKNISYAKYSGSIKEAIIHFKFNNRREGFRYFGEMLLFLLEKEKLPKIDVLAAVPIHKKRLAERGYNQCDLIARYLSDKLKIPYADTELIKIKDIPPQSSLKSKKDRQKNVEGAFAVLEKRIFRGKRVLVIDDVFTTGATMSEVTKVLLKSDATEVYSITVAMAGIEKM